MKGVAELGDEPGGLGLLLGFRLVVAGIAGAGLGFERGGRSLLGALAESPVDEDIGSVDAVVGGGVFSDALSDVVEHEDDFAAAVGFGEDGVGEIERRVGWDLLGCGVHGYFNIMLGHICCDCQVFI